MDFLAQILLDLPSDASLCLDSFKILHFLHLLDGQAPGEHRNGERVAPGNPPSQTRIALEDLDFDALGVDGRQRIRIAGVNIMQVDAVSALAEFGVGRRPLCSGPQVHLARLVARRVAQVEVDHDVMNIIRLDVVKLRRIEIAKLRLDRRPALLRRARFVRVLRGAFGEHFVEQGLRLGKLQHWLRSFRFSLLLWFRLLFFHFQSELLAQEAAIVVAHLTAVHAGDVQKLTEVVLHLLAELVLSELVFDERRIAIGLVHVIAAA